MQRASPLMIWHALGRGPANFLTVLGDYLWAQFWHLGTTRENHGRSRMDTKLQITGFLSIWEWFLEYLSVVGLQIALHFVFWAGFQVIVYRLLIQCFGVGDFQIPGFAWKVFQKSFFHGNPFWRTPGSFVVFFPWEEFPWIFKSWKQIQNPIDL